MHAIPAAALFHVLEQPDFLLPITSGLANGFHDTLSTDLWLTVNFLILLELVLLSKVTGCPLPPPLRQHFQALTILRGSPGSWPASGQINTSLVCHLHGPCVDELGFRDEVLPQGPVYCLLGNPRPFQYINCLVALQSNVHRNTNMRGGVPPGFKATLGDQEPVLVAHPKVVKLAFNPHIVLPAGTAGWPSCAHHLTPDGDGHVRRQQVRRGVKVSTDTDMLNPCRLGCIHDLRNLAALFSIIT
jgi:hypothetical protein